MEKRIWIVMAIVAVFGVAGLPQGAESNAPISEHCLVVSDGPLKVREVMHLCAPEQACQLNPAEQAAKRVLLDKGDEHDASTIDWFCGLPDRAWVLDAAKDGPHVVRLNAERIRRANRINYHPRASEARNLDAPPGERAAAGLPGATTLKGASLESAVLWGLAEFMLKRANEEANLWVLDKLRDDMCGGGSAYAPLLKSTCPLLLDRGVPGPFGGLTTLRAALRKDAKALPMTIGTVYAHGQCGDGDRATCDGAVTLSLVGSIVNRLVEGDAPAEALFAGAQKDRWAAQYLSIKDTTVADALLRAMVLLQAIVTVDADGTVHLAELKGKDHLDSALLAGTVNLVDFRNMPPVSTGWINIEKEPSTILPIPRDRMDQLTVVRQAITNAQDAYQKVRDLKEQASGAPKAQLMQAWSGAVRATFSVLDTSLSLREDGAPRPRASDPKASKALAIVKHGPALAESLATPDYGEVVVRLSSMAFELGFRQDKLPPELNRVLGFVVDVAQAADTASVEIAIKNLAAPVQSYKGKRWAKKAFLKLNGYVGGFAASERLDVDPSVVTERRTRPSVAPWVPVGLELGASPGAQQSFSVFVHVLDIGALAAYRFENQESDIDDAPAVRIKQVFSPGVFGVYGFKNSPVTLAAGISASPSLRSVKDEAAEEGVRPLSAVRVGVALAFDIPLFP